MPHTMDYESNHCHADDAGMADLQKISSGRDARFSDRQHLLFAGDTAHRSHLLQEGFAARCVSMRDGRRQITALYICGDFIDLQSYADHAATESLIAVGPCSTTSFRNSDLNSARLQSIALSDGLLQLAERNGLIARAWIASLGRREAGQHLAHLVCELLVRTRAAGTTTDHQFMFPAGQEHLADILGLSIVHVNRVLQALRRAGLISWQRNILKVLDFKRLSALAEFDATYLDHGGLGVPAKLPPPL